MARVGGVGRVSLKLEKKSSAGAKFFRPRQTLAVWTHLKYISVVAHRRLVLTVAPMMMLGFFVPMILSVGFLSQRLVLLLQECIWF